MTPIHRGTPLPRAAAGATARGLVWLRKNGLPLALTAACSLALWWISGTPCLMHGIIGLPCPGCGLTRATHMLLQGNLTAALQAHPLFWLAWVVLAALPGMMWLRPAWLSTRGFRRVAVAISGLFLAVYVIRMICFFPHTAPMVYNTRSLLGRLLVWIDALV